MYEHNLFISKLNEKDVNHFTTDVGLFLRRKSHKLFRKLCNFFTHTKVIYTENVTMTQMKNITEL